MLIDEFVITKLFTCEEVKLLTDAAQEDFRVFNIESEYDVFACFRDLYFEEMLIEILKSKGVNVDGLNFEHDLKSLKNIIEFIKY